MTQRAAITKRVARTFLLFACSALAATPAWAHHSFAAEFDADKPIKLRGKVTKVEFINPTPGFTSTSPARTAKSSTGA